MHSFTHIVFCIRVTFIIPIFLLQKIVPRFFKGMLDGKKPPAFSEYEYSNAEVFAARAFGKQQLFDPQRKSIRALFTGQDVMSVLPTGNGKTMVGWAILVLLDFLLNGIGTERLVLSCCFLPVAVYFSPLIELMDAQVAEFNSHASRHGLLPAVRCSQDQPPVILSRIRNGLVSVLYMSPEAALDAFFFIFESAVYAGRIILCFYDECHLVLEWGEEFRKQFQELLCIRSRTGFHIPWIATSATVTPDMKPQIIEHLGLMNLS